jgi:calcineurin-like phosphoesterase family protein
MEQKIFFTSDLHLNHNRDFIYGTRNFSSIEEMNQEIIKRYNEVVSVDDIVYCLGDLCLGGGSTEVLYQNKELIECLNGHIYIILGNHDTNARIEMYKTCKNVAQILGYSTLIKYKKYHFYLSHYPTLTANLDEGKSLSQIMINLYGHTHQNTNFYKDMPINYHVGVDSHNCYPIEINQIIKDIKNKIKECEEQL